MCIMICVCVCASAINISRNTSWHAVWFYKSEQFFVQISLLPQICLHKVCSQNIILFVFLNFCFENFTHYYISRIFFPIHNCFQILYLSHISHFVFFLYLKQNKQKEKTERKNNKAIKNYGALFVLASSPGHGIGPQVWLIEPMLLH